MFWDASLHLDKTNTLFYSATNHFATWGEGLGGGSGMCVAGKAAGAAGRLYMVLLIKSHFSLNTMGFP